MSPVMLAVAAGLLLAGGAATAAPGTVAERIARLDEMQKNRDNPEVAAEARQLADALVREAGNSYDAVWRSARLYTWLAEGGRSKDARASLAKKAWELGERAIKLKGDGVEGHYYAALGIGAYAFSAGVMKAVSQGLDGKFRERMSKAGKINGRFDNGGVDVAWGRYYEKVPWPKRDKKKAEQHYRRALQTNPWNLRARAYLAELMLDEDHPKEAKAVIDVLRRAKPGKYDAPEERRARAIGLKLLPKILDELN